MKLQLNILLLFFTTVTYGQDNVSLINGALRANFGANGELAAADNGHFLSLLVDGEYKPLVFDAGLLVAGLDENENLEFHDLRGATTMPGIIGNTDPVNTYWRVTAEEIAAHQADYADNGVIDNPIASIYAWPGRGNPHLEEYNGFAIDNFSLSLAGFWDQEQNGLYNPEEGDFPVLDVRNCAEQPVVVSEMIFFPIMSTSNGATDPNIQIFLTAFRVGCEEVDNPISNALFLHYKLIRITESSELSTLTGTRYGLLVDGDIGCPADDYMGTFPQRWSTYFYNAAEIDTDCMPSGSSYGNNPPAVAIDIFRAGLNEIGEENGIENIMPVFNGSIGNYPPATTDYNTPVEAYNYLQGKWRDGAPLLDEGLGYDTGNAANFAFDGFPVTEDGWSEVNANNPGGDRRAIISSAPFTYLPGATNEFILGFTYNDDPNASHTEKIIGLRDNVDLIQALFDACFELNEFSMEHLDCSPLTTDIEEFNLPKPSFDIYPNPTNSILQIETKDTDKGLLQVFLSNGQMVLEKKLSNGLHQLDVTDWPKGLYLVQWKNKQEVATKKLIIN